MLKYKLDSTAFEKLSDAEKGFYSESDGDYVLQVEGAVDKSKLDEFRQNNVELMKAQEKYKSIDLDKYNEALENEKKLREQQLIKDQDFDTLIKEKTAALESDYQAKLKNMESELNKTKGDYEGLISKHEIEGAAYSAFSKHKISPDAQKAALAQIKTQFTINNGQAVAMDGDKILTGANGNLSIDEFVGGLPEIFKIPSNGGAARGGDGSNSNASLNSMDKISSGLQKRFSGG